MARLSDPITILKGIGAAKAKQFANLNIVTLRDLICHFPRGYEDRTKIVPIEKLEVDTPACFRGMVMNSPRTNHIRKGLDLTKVQVADHTARLNLTFFNNKYVSENLQYGREYIFYGAVSGDFIGYNMTNPVFEALDSAPVTTRRILPIYPLTAGLTNGAVLKAVRQALAICDPPAEILPEAVRREFGILDADRAYQAIHEPTSLAEAEAAKIIENSQRDINIAFMNEIAIVFNALGIDTTDVLKAAGTKWNFLNFSPGLVGGHCISVDPYYLIQRATSRGVVPRIMMEARRLNNTIASQMSASTTI